MGLAARPFWLDLPLWVFVACAVFLVAFAASMGVAELIARRWRRGQVRRRVLAQLALAVERGAPLDRALSALATDLSGVRSGGSGVGRALRDLVGLFVLSKASDQRSERLQGAVVEEVARKLQDGDLGGALRVRSDAFPAPWPALLGEGQRRGTLALVVAEVQRLEETTQRIRRRIAARLIYPGFVFAFVQLPLWFMVLVTDPKLNEVLPLPASFAPLQHLRTLLLIGVPVFLVWLLLSPLLLAPDRALRLPFRDALPGVRALHRALRRLRFARLLGVFLRAGVPLPDALSQLAPLGAPAGPRGLDAEARLRRAAAAAREGAPVHAALAAGEVFPGEDLDVLAGWAGRDVQALEQVASAAAEDVERIERRLAAAVFPAGILGVAALVAIQYWIPFLHLKYAVEEYPTPW